MVHQLNFIGEFLKANIKHRVLVNLDIRDGEYFPKYANYFGISLRLNNSMYGKTNYVNIFGDGLKNWLVGKSGFK